MLDHRPRLTDYDLDAIALYTGAPLCLCASNTAGLSSDFLASLPVYKRGRELAGDDEPRDHYSAEREFDRVLAIRRRRQELGTKPPPDPVFDRIYTSQGYESHDSRPFIAAWERQIPNVPCPIKAGEGFAERMFAEAERRHSQRQPESSQKPKSTQEER